MAAYVPPHRRRRPQFFFGEAYCINLARRRDRWRHFERAVAAAGLVDRAQRFEAVDGAAVAEHPDFRGDWDATSNARFDKHASSEQRSASAGERGCALSHAALWRRAAAGEGTTLVLEDDARFRRDLRERLEELPADWDVLYLGFSDRGERRHVESFGRCDLFEPEYGFATHAYALTAGAARTLVAQLPVRGPVDVWLADNHWFGLRVRCAVVRGEGWRGTGAYLVDQAPAFRSDVAKSSRDDDALAARVAGLTISSERQEEEEDSGTNDAAGDESQ